MSSKEVKATEETIQEIIGGDNTVYAKESALSLAKDIKGIRAIFDEVMLSAAASKGHCANKIITNNKLLTSLAPASHHANIHCLRTR